MVLKTVHLRGCNQNCIFCFKRDNPKKGIDSFEEFVRQIEQYKNEVDDKKSLVIEFCSEESTIHPHFLKMIEHLKQENIPFKLISNGRMLSSEKFLEHLISRGLISAEISLHSCNKEHQESITRTKGSYEQTIKGIENCVKRIPIRVNTVICKTNKYDILDTEIMLVENLGVKKVKILGLLGFSCPEGFSHEDILVRYDEIKDILEKTSDYLESKNIDFCFEHFQPCLLKKNNRYLKIQKIYELNEKDNPKQPSCSECTKKSSCFGIPRTYTRTFGEFDFEPFLD